MPNAPFALNGQNGDSKWRRATSKKTLLYGFFLVKKVRLFYLVFPPFKVLKKWKEIKLNLQKMKKEKRNPVQSLIWVYLKQFLL